MGARLACSGSRTKLIARAPELDTQAQVRSTCRRAPSGRSLESRQAPLRDSVHPRGKSSASPFFRLDNVQHPRSRAALVPVEGSMGGKGDRLGKTGEVAPLLSAAAASRWLTLGITPCDEVAASCRAMTYLEEN